MLWDNLWDDHGRTRMGFDPRNGIETLYGSRFAVEVVLLHASTGVAVGRELVAPAANRGPRGEATMAFLRGGVAAIAYSAASGVVAASSLPLSGLPPPAVLVWDWRSALCLHAVLLHPLPESLPRAASPEAPRPLRFPIGTSVECRVGPGHSTGNSWLRGVVAGHHVGTGFPGQPPLPYLVHLDGGDICYAPVDDARIIRSAVDAGEDLAWNGCTQALEVAARASLVIHPSSSRLAIGMWHDHAAAGVLFSIDIGPHCDGDALAVS